MQELTLNDFARYNRHLILPEIGTQGQKKIKNAKVLVVGTGGLGSPCSLYLAAAGIGTLGLVDFDVVDVSNLQRQILFGTAEIGKSKVESAKKRLLNLNPEIKITTYEAALTSENALKIIENYDLVVDGTDNFATRYLVNDACVFLGKPNVYGSIFKFEGQASVFNYQNGPCYRCLYPEPPPVGLVPSCAEGGVLGVLPGIIGSIQATETIKIITGAGEILSGKFLLYDALSMDFTKLKIHKNPDCVVCGKNRSVTKLIDYKQFCGVGKEEKNFEEITVFELKKYFEENKKFTLLDVREPYELEISKLPQSLNIPAQSIPERTGELNSDVETVVFCRSGARSAKVCDFLLKQNFKVKNLKGGILAWSKEIDKNLPAY
ncbi:molybdopterin-synthase adenylyltransferase MoeB [bacterium]|nr:molybdopterin-synthase adenylyltransferase MoeB [bacterium]